MVNNLNRFLEAQNGKSIYGNTLYKQALKEMQEGKVEFECWIRAVNGTDSEAFKTVLGEEPSPLKKLTPFTKRS